MTYYLQIIARTLGYLMSAAALTCWGYAAWLMDGVANHDDRWAPLGIVFLVAAIGLFVAGYGPIIEKPLPRAERKQLERERARIRLEREIKRLEEEEL